MNDIIDDFLSSNKRVPDGEILLQDALSMMKGLEAGSVAAIVTDPPYGIGYHSNRHEGKNPHAPIQNDWNFQIGPFFDQASRVLSDGGALYLFTRFDVFPLWASAIPHSLSLKNMIVWNKGTHTSGDLTGNFGFRHELIMFITKGRHKLRGYRWSNVWDVPKISPKKLRMPAEKPVELYERAIESSSQTGELVIDPFCGSGTMAEAATNLSRRFITCDTDKNMVRMAQERLGIPITVDDDALIVPAPVFCPVYQIEVPDTAVWGVHPEDILDWKNR